MHPLLLPPVSFSFLRAFLANAFKSASGRGEPDRPLLLSYFVTFRCDLACSYCDYSTGHLAGRFPELDTGGAREVLRICREGIPGIAFSGGEPLVRTDIAELVRYARELRYRPISLFTNSLRLPEVEEILDDIDYLQISLDTLDPDLQDRLCGRPGSGRRIIANIERYAALQRERRFRLNINCVLSSETLGSVRDLLRFALDMNVRFTLSPQLDEKGQPSGFFHDPAVFEQYQACIDSVLSYKRSTDGVLDIVPFLQHLRELEAGPCYPLLTPRVYPNGSLRFPCSIVCRSALSVPGMGSWKNIMRALEPVSGSCPAPCLLPCYLETSLLVDNPRELLQELNWTR